MGKKRSKSKSISADLEFAKLRARVRQASSLHEGIRNYRVETDPHVLLNTASKFAKHPAYRSLVARDCFPNEFSKLPRDPFPYVLSLHNELAWALSFITDHSSQLRDLLCLKRQVDAEHLSGNLSALDELLTNANAAHGVSLWLVESRIKYFQLAKGHHARNEYIAKAKLQKGPWLVEHLVNWISYRVGATTSPTDFFRLLNRIWPPDNGLSLLIHALNGHYLPANTKMTAQMISYSDNLPLIDRYEILVLALQCLAVSSKVTARDAAFISFVILKLYERIGDTRLISLMIAFDLNSPPLPIDEHFLRVLDLYTNEDYVGVVSALAARPKCLSSIEQVNLAIRAESLVTPGHTLHSVWTEPLPLSAQIQADLRSIANIHDDAIEARQRLQKTVLTYCNCPWASGLSLIISRQTNDERVFLPIVEQSVWALRSDAPNPILAFSMPTESTVLRYLAAVEAASAGSRTVQALKIILGASSDKPSHMDSRESRLVRFEAFWLARKGAFHEAANLLKARIDLSPRNLLSFEDQTLLVRMHAAANQLAESADVAASLFVQSNYFGTILPIRELVKSLLVEHDKPMDAAPTRGRMSVAIVFDIYSRTVSQDRDSEKADAYKDVLRRAGVTRASELAKVKPGLFTTDELVYFLHHVCTPEILDQSLALRSTREVEDERVAILLALTDLVPSEGRTPLAAIKDELREIRTRQVVRETTLRLDQSKVYVNIAGIRRAIDVEMRESWNRYQLLTQASTVATFRDLEARVRSAYGDKITLILLDPVATEPRVLFNRMIRELREQFTASKEYGLNSNLSANIRHGYVLRELRGPLVGRNLITNKETESGHYHRNSYWLERLPSNNVWQGQILSELLATFSAQIDETIEHLNRRLLRIRTDQNPDGLFDYELTETGLAAVETRWGAIQAYEDFVETVFGFFWEVTQKNLDRVRTALKGKVLVSFTEVLTSLEQELRNNDLDTLIPPLVNALTLAKTEMHAAIERVSSWFTLPGNSEYQDFDLEIAFRAGLQTVETYYKNVRISHSYYSEQDQILPGWSLPMFARLFFLLLDNAALHGAGNRGSLKVDLNVSAGENRLILEIRNDLPEDIDTDQLARRIDAINRDYGQAKAMEMLGEEGGSGYPKIWKILKTDLGRREHSVVVSTHEGLFAVSVSMSTEGLRP